jgi:hypothetical protein
MSSPVVVARSYCVLIGGFLFVRASTTLLAGASFGLPGDGWRSLLQLVAAAILAVGAARRSVTLPAVSAIGVLYALQTALGLLGGDAILGAIPVDMRDRVVHPAIALLALAVIATVSARRSRAGS